MSIHAALEALLWSNGKEGVQPFKELMARLTREWNAFKSSLDSIGFDATEHRIGYIDFEIGDEWDYCAHNWIMSRNGEGCEFWDGGWDKKYASQLHQIACSFGALGIEEYRGRIYPYSIVYIPKFATYSFVKYKESKCAPQYNKENPSSYMIKLPEVDNKWRRVYTIDYGNNSSDWVYIKKERVCLGNLLVGEHVYVNGEAIRIEIH